MTTESLQLKLKLLDTRVITGVYIDRSKNFSETTYEVAETPDKIAYTRRNKSILGKQHEIDFEKLMA